MNKQTFKNTFAPWVENEELTVDNIIKGLFIGIIEYDDLPEKIKDIVDMEMQNRVIAKNSFRVNM